MLQNNRKFSTSGAHHVNRGCQCYRIIENSAPQVHIMWTEDVNAKECSKFGTTDAHHVCENHEKFHSMQSVNKILSPGKMKLHITLVTLDTKNQVPFYSLPACFSSWILSLLIFFCKINCFPKMFSGIPSVSNSLDPEQARQTAQDPNCLQSIWQNMSQARVTKQ